MLACNFFQRLPFLEEKLTTVTAEQTTDNQAKCYVLTLLDLFVIIPTDM